MSDIIENLGDNKFDAYDFDFPSATDSINLPTRESSIIDNKI